PQKVRSSRQRYSTMPKNVTPNFCLTVATITDKSKITNKIISRANRRKLQKHFVEKSCPMSNTRTSKRVKPCICQGWSIRKGKRTTVTSRSTKTQEKQVLSFQINIRKECSLQKPTKRKPRSIRRAKPTKRLKTSKSL